MFLFAKVLYFYDMDILICNKNLCDLLHITIMSCFPADNSVYFYTFA